MAHGRMHPSQAAVHRSRCSHWHGGGAAGFQFCCRARWQQERRLTWARAEPGNRPILSDRCGHCAARRALTDHCAFLFCVAMFHSRLKDHPLTYNTRKWYSRSQYPSWLVAVLIALIILQQIVIYMASSQECHKEHAAGGGAALVSPLQLNRAAASNCAPCALCPSCGSAAATEAAVAVASAAATNQMVRYPEYCSERMRGPESYDTARYPTIEQSHLMGMTAKTLAGVSLSSLPSRCSPAFQSRQRSYFHRVYLRGGRPDKATLMCTSEDFILDHYARISPNPNKVLFEVGANKGFDLVELYARWTNFTTNLVWRTAGKTLHPGQLKGCSCCVVCLHFCPRALQRSLSSLSSLPCTDWFLVCVLVFFMKFKAVLGTQTSIVTCFLWYTHSSPCLPLWIPYDCSMHLFHSVIYTYTRLLSRDQRHKRKRLSWQENQAMKRRT